jgi:outer membrane protein
MKRIFLLVIGFLMFIVFQGKTETINFKKYLEHVNQHSNELKLAAKDKDLAKVQKRQAVAGALPKIMMQADYNRNLNDYYMYADLGGLFGDDAGGPVKFKVNRNNEYSANVALQQTLFSPTVGNAIRAAKEYQKLTDFIYDASHQAILTVAKKMFYQGLLLEKVWQVSQSAEGNARENYDHMKKKYDNGVVSEFELLQAEVRWQSTIPQTAEAKRNHQLILNNLKKLAGIPVQDEIDLEGDFEEYSGLPVDVNLETVLTRRPDFNALLWEEKLRHTNLRATKSSFLPTLTGTLIYAYSAQSDYYKLEQENNLYIAGVNLSLPIFTGGYRSAEVQKARLELEKTGVKISQTKDDIYNHMTNIYLRLKEAHTRISTADVILKTAKKAFTIAENTAKSGLATQLQLKDARVGFDQAQLNYYAAIFDYLVAHFDWEQATGQVK